MLSSVVVEEAWEVAATEDRLVVWEAYVVEKIPLKDRAAAPEDEVAWVAGNRDRVVHGRAEGTAAGMGEGTTAAGSAGMEASLVPWAEHSTAGSCDGEPCEADYRGHCAASDEEVLAFAATVGHRLDSCCYGRQEPT